MQENYKLPLRRKQKQKKVDFTTLDNEAMGIGLQSYKN